MARVKCSKCGFEGHRPNAKFCVQCGTKLGCFCPECGQENEAEARFCESCGASLKGEVEGSAPIRTSAPAPPPPSPQADPSPSPPRSERRAVTVLFSDISGFTSLSEQLDPEDVTRVITAGLDLLTTAVQKFGGTVDKYIGDCVMALFGAPLAHEDDPLRAVRCALEMQELFASFAKGTGHDIGLSIGINTGSVLAGRIGSSTRQDYTVMGDAVNLAQRLQSKAGRGNIYAGPDTFRLTSAEIEFESVGELQVKGKREPVACYRVLGVLRKSGPARTRESLPVSFVGRSRELALVEECLDQSLAGRPQVVSIVGDTGLGKTALKDRLLSFHASKVGQVTDIECSSFLVETTYSVFRQVLRNILEIGPDDPLAAVDEKLESLSSLGLGGPEIDLFRHVLQGSEGKGLTRYLDPKVRRDETFRAFLNLCRSIWRKDPAIVVIEDLQWMDELSRELMDLVIRRLEGLSVLVVLTFRPEFAHSWANLPYYHQINLTPLPPNEIVELATLEMGGAGAVAPDLGAFLIEKSAGNPLFLKELITILRERNWLEEKEGLVGIRGGIKDIELPTGIRSIIGARIDRLSERLRHILHHAAVIGRNFSLDLLGHMLAEKPSLTEIEELIQKDVLVPLDRPGDFSFRHAVIRDVVYQRVLKEDLAKLHLTVAETIETVNFWSVEEYSEVLAYHFLEGGDKQKALQYQEMSGDKLARNFSNEAALRHCKQALALVSPELEFHVEILIRLKYKAGQLLAILGRAREALDHLDEALKTAQVEQLVRWVYVIHLERGRLMHRGGKLDAAEKDYREAVELATRMSDMETILEGTRRIAGLELQGGRIGEALKMLEEARPGVIEFDHPGLSARYLNDMGIAYYKVGRWDDAIRAYEQSLLIKRHLGDRKAVEITLGNLGEAYLFRKSFDEAEKSLKEALALGRELGDRLGVAVGLHNLAVLDFERGAFAASEQKFGEALEISEEIEWAEGQLLNPMYLARIKMINGAAEQGRHEMEQTIERATVLKLDEPLATGLFLLAEALSERGERDQAVDLLGQARTLAEKMQHAILLEKIGKAAIDAEQRGRPLS